MISVIIPYLAYMPYKDQIKRTLSDLKRQTADIEIIVSEQPIIEKHTKICKGKLHNLGFKASTGDIIFHCDADIIIEDETLLERMENKLREGFDVIYPMFWSITHEANKLADGHPFMTREVLEEYGPLNEEDKGISLVSFRLLHWLYYNKRFHSSDEFKIELNTEPFTKRINKSDRATRLECLPIAVEVINDLKGEELWPGIKRSV